MRVQKILYIISFLTIVLINDVQSQNQALEMTLYSDRDATISELYKNVNFGNYPGLWLQNSPSTERSRALLHFDLASIKKGSKILKAFVRLRCKSVGLTEYFGLIKPISSEWDEERVTWASQPSTFDSYYASFRQGPIKTSGYLDTDVTNLVQMWVNDELKNYGFLIQAPNEFISNEFYEAASREYSGGDTWYPVLFIKYEAPSEILADSDNPEINWMQIDEYNLSNHQVNSSIRKYYDDLGQEKQIQKKIFENNSEGNSDHIIASETIFDSYGREAIKTLYAPTRLNYYYYGRNNPFITNSANEPYSYKDFDLESNITHPESVSVNCPLGEFYSTNNTVDSYSDCSSFPYVRLEYSRTQPNLIRTRTLAGEEHLLGTNHSFQSFNLNSNVEEIPAYVNYIYSYISEPYNTTYPIPNEVIKRIEIDPQQNKTAVFYDSKGKKLAKCKIGNQVNAYAQYSFPKQVIKPYFDLYVIGEKIDVNISELTSNTFKIIDLMSDDEIQYSIKENQLFLPDGFYRIQLLDDDQECVLTIPNGYYDFCYYYYDLKDHLIMEIPPVGPSGGNMVIHYKYNSSGRLIESQTPDNGKTQYVYTNAGKLRFYENANQVSTRKYSYINYDNIGRIIETGVYLPSNINDPDAFSINMDPSLVLNVSKCFERTIIRYDFQDAGLSQIPGLLDKYKKQNFITRRISKTSNDQAITWYSYDERGNIEWVVISYPYLPIKTIFYDYDGTNKLVKTIYNESQIDVYTHIYKYNTDGQLIEVATEQGNNTHLVQVKYFYDQLNHCYRKEIGHGIFSQALQGIDYLFNINGWLKSINSPTLQPKNSLSNDPGLDKNDLFGAAYNYHDNDFNRPFDFLKEPVGISTYYDGKIGQTRWKTFLDQETNYPSENYFGFNYDNYNRLASNTFGTVKYPIQTGLQVNQYLPSPGFNENITYDANGNIKTLKRNGKPNALPMDDFKYVYSTNSLNRLIHITDDVRTDSYSDDLLDSNFEYDLIGRLTKDDTYYYKYNEKNKLIGVYSDVNMTNYTALYSYDERGFRIKKVIKSGNTNYFTFYIRDMVGNIVSVYESSSLNPNPGTISLSELVIYGDSRIGTLNPTTNTIHYELVDHQGSQRALFKRNASLYYPELIGSTDYYPFGWTLPGRNTQNATNKYFYQGQFSEKDAETNHYHFMARDYESRIGRWNLTDPSFQNWSPYTFCNNQPHIYVDPDGKFSVMPWWLPNGTNGVTDGAEYFAPGVTPDGYFCIGNDDMIFQDYELSAVSITGGMSQEQVSAQYLGIYRMHEAFILGSIDLTFELMSKTGEVVSYGGYALAATGVGAEVGIPIATVGSYISSIGNLGRAAVSFYHNDNDNALYQVGSTAISFIAPKPFQKMSCISKPDLLKINAFFDLVGTPLDIGFDAVFNDRSDFNDRN